MACSIFVTKKTEEIWSQSVWRQARGSADLGRQKKAPVAEKLQARVLP